MTVFRCVLLLFLCATWHLAMQCDSPAQEPAAAKQAFSPEQEQSRRQIIDSTRWQDARQKFDRWLSVQTTYNADQVASMQKKIEARINSMSADQLQAFLNEMEQRLDVLLSPETTAARNWVDEFYTPQGKRELAQKYGLADPIDMSAAQLSGALTKFAEDRQAQRSSQAAFVQSQALQANAVREYRQAQQAAAQQAAAASAQRSASYGHSYAPTRAPRPQRYQAPYSPMRYSIGPWGGVWMGY